MTWSPISIQTESLALRALRKQKPQETQAIAFEWNRAWAPDIRLRHVALYNVLIWFDLISYLHLVPYNHCIYTSNKRYKTEKTSAVKCNI